MKYKGRLFKMSTNNNVIVDYWLPVEDEKIYMNEVLGKKLKFSFLDQIRCIRCGRKTNKSFSQGYCYPCFRSAPETDACVLHPELCQAHIGISRDMSWSEKNCLQPHYVYLSLTSGIKVGVTRQSQVPTRWIDQGAWKALKIAKTPNRYQAGRIEVLLKNHLSDKTNWRKMLQNDIDKGADLLESQKTVLSLLDNDMEKYILKNEEIIEIKYPHFNAPPKVKSLSFDKTKMYEGILTGIKGQYLIFEDSTVINIRKHSGYIVEVEI